VSLVTITQARADLRARRLDQKWSFDALYADMVRVLGERSPTPATIRRFILNEVEPEETTAHVIKTYLETVRGEQAA
jgi:hypothetical protein